jgi:dihydroflavonol-4-reductase
MSHRVAVVGGTGFLGANVVAELLRAGYTPVVVARHPEKLAKALPDVEVETRCGDVTDPDSLRTALEGCTYVHNTAAMASDLYRSPTPEKADAVIKTNLDGAMNVLRAAHERGARGVAVTSSASTRYQPKGRLANEDSPPDKEMMESDAYIRSKVLMEQAAADFGRETGLGVVLILPGGMIGPRDAAPTALGAGLVARLNRPARRRIGIDGAVPLVDVRDAARAHVAAMERGKPGACYLVVAETISLREWGAMVGRATGFPSAAVTLPAPIAMTMMTLFQLLARLRGQPPRVNRAALRHITQRQQYDCSRAKQKLGITFTPLETALRDAVAWYVEHGWVTDPERLKVVQAALKRDQGVGGHAGPVQQ